MENPSERESVNELRDRVFAAASEHDREYIEEYVDGALAADLPAHAREILEHLEGRRRALDVPATDAGDRPAHVRGMAAEESLLEMRGRLLRTAVAEDREFIEEYVDGAIAGELSDYARSLLEDIERRPAPDDGSEG